MLSKKHYEAIAVIIEKYKSGVSGPVVSADVFQIFADNLCQDLADYFKQDNPRFDRERFLKACGVGG